MKAAEEIYERFAKWGLRPGAKDKLIEEIHAYARQCCEDLRERCAENARIRPIPYYTGPDDAFEVDRESITNIDIILK